MIISEQQVMQLITFAHLYRTDLMLWRAANNLTEQGQNTLDQISELLSNVSNNQSPKLKVIE